MKRLLLLRHAKASREPGETSDHARPLAPAGIWAAEKVAGHCAKRLHQVDFTLCSSAIRTRETLRLFERNLPPSSKVVVDDRLYLADTKALRIALRAVDDRVDVVLLVGHEPGLSDLVQSLCGTSGRAKAMRLFAKGFKTSALLTIDLKIDHWSELRPGVGTLREMVRPKDLG